MNMWMEWKKTSRPCSGPSGAEAKTQKISVPKSDFLLLNAGRPWGEENGCGMKVLFIGFLCRWLEVLISGTKLSYNVAHLIFNMYIYIFYRYIFTVHTSTDVCFALSWAGSFWGLILFWWCFDAFLSFPSYQTLEVHVGNWTHGLWSNCQESISIDFMVWLMVKDSNIMCHPHGGLSVGGKLMGMFLSSARVSSWSAMLMVGWVLVGFVRGNHVAEIGSAGKRFLGAAAGWWAGGWGASPLSTQIVMKQRKIRHEAFLL